MGTVPTQLGRLSLLEYLTLSNNALEGSPPSQLGLLTALDVLRLERNRFNGTLPTELAQLSQLQHLYVLFIFVFLLFAEVYLFSPVVSTATR